MNFYFYTLLLNTIMPKDHLLPVFMLLLLIISIKEIDLH